MQKMIENYKPFVPQLQIETEKCRNEEKCREEQKNWEKQKYLEEQKSNRKRLNRHSKAFVPKQK